MKFLTSFLHYLHIYYRCIYSHKRFVIESGSCRVKVFNDIKVLLKYKNMLKCSMFKNTIKASKFWNIKNMYKLFWHNYTPILVLVIAASKLYIITSVKYGDRFENIYYLWIIFSLQNLQMCGSEGVSLPASSFIWWSCSLSLLNKQSVSHCNRV